MKSHIWRIILSAVLLDVVFGDCSVTGLQGCLTEFLITVSPAGIRLKEEALARACLVRDGTLLCMSDFMDQCVPSSEPQLEQSINASRVFIADACMPNSSLRHSVSEYEDCYVNASDSFLSCYKKILIPEPGKDDRSKWKAECCGHKAVYDCALQTVQEGCDAHASETMQHFLFHVQGAGLQHACGGLYDECSSCSTIRPMFLLPVILLLLYIFL